MRLPSTSALAKALASEIAFVDNNSNALAGFHEEAQYQAGLAHWLREKRNIFSVIEGPYSGDRWKERCGSPK